MTITITSEAFSADQTIPTRFTGEGENISPPLLWSGAPEQTHEFALICDDPDAPRADPWVHWVIYKIPSDVDALTEGIPSSPRLASPAGAIQGMNSAGNIGYMGPMPPRGHGKHHYHFKLYALDTELQLSPGLQKSDLLKAMQGHILAQGELIGTYERK